MRALFITPMLPLLSPADKGGKHRRASLFLNALTRFAPFVDVLYLVPPAMMPLGEDPAGLNATQSELWGVPLRVTLAPRRSRPTTRWSQYGAGILYAAGQPALFPYGGSALTTIVGNWLRGGEAVVCADRLDAMMPIIEGGFRPPHLFLDVDDIYHRVAWRAARTPPHEPWRMLPALQIPALMAAERRAIARSDLAFVCSDEDAVHLRHLGFPRHIRTVPNAIAVPPNPPGIVTAPTLLYLGTFHHPPNVLAAERLVTRIWPRILAAMPQAKLRIAGAYSDTLPSCAVAPAGVTYLGFVDDLADLYAQTRLVCTPITTGSGTRLKLLEAASYARPMVSTRLGAEGLLFQDGRDILLREDDAALAEACLQLLRDDTACQRLGTSARTVVQTHYEAGAVVDMIVGQMEAAIG